MSKRAPQADLRKGVMPEDLFRFHWIEDLSLDPRGTLAAYTVKQADATLNGYVRSASWCRMVTTQVRTW
jgi:hypothetical protein